MERPKSATGELRSEGDRSLTLRPLPPFDFDLSASIFSTGFPEYRVYDGGEFRQALRLDGILALCRVTSKGTVEEPALRVRLESDSPISPAGARRAGRLLTRMFNLDMDLAPFYRAVAADPVMSRLAERLYGLKSPTTPTVFEALVDSIIEQQISLASAHSMQRRLIHAFGDRLELDRTYYLFPTPERLAASSHAAVRACGLSGRKSEYVRSVAKMVAGGELDLDKYERYEDIGLIREELSGIRGVGPWTAEMTMIRGLHKLDSVPADDVGLQAKIAHYYGRTGKVSSADLRQVAESWGPYRGLGGYYLIVAHHLGIAPEKGPNPLS